MNDIKRENEYLVDDISQKLIKLQNLSEDITQYEEEIKRSQEEMEKFKQQIDEQTQINGVLSAKLDKRKLLIPQIKNVFKSLSEIEKTNSAGATEDIEFELIKQKELRDQIEKIKRSMNDTTIRSKSLIKKNQMKASELEAKIKRNSSSTNLLTLEQNEKQKVGPSMIIHKTQDSQADEVRLLHTSMEDSLRANSTLRAQLNNLKSDLNAVREENAALKELMRNVMNSQK
ncbi:hypothetical protein TRFO_09751 [Tritrichomonas foetus]|uniref:Uncharacterized protein n=1 Tax=Tritrichomonas foetus TaxID=1144522 RepID=A0A1J4JCE6_9EUKA|nr:hypothetical protein TRFO_09751 [Tritrichomonas foetus]|eukprot:OHS96854.1 hypothetical protein TRFO_09751 [Tritrichomonas foetus]